MVHRTFFLFVVIAGLTNSVAFQRTRSPLLTHHSSAPLGGRDGNRYWGPEAGPARCRGGLVRRNAVSSMVKLRRATVHDIPRIVELAATTFGAADPENVEDRLFRWSVDKGFHARIGGDWDDRDHCVFVATDDSDDDLVGLIEVSMQPQTGATAPPFPVPAFLKRLSIRPLFPYISNLVIADKERRKGYAKRLVRACEQQARGWGYDRCYLHVDLNYPPAAALYEGMGYGIVKDDPGWMKTVNGVALR
eukprot:CAMPEP_0205906580 /NCGR_PEP_ID=MMETSP1325-20131115/2029_1 /ASSEMBLY_ACC=CAM_ASM_000708 /TAXON_ID=236786 /ORGANISM="Florenciella sp., Strain RCC1007" /LENGTH=247 /DNA_ID=CAMNT_0053272605 /DNA_START=84 /DNA_END=823 /DNA_ORIENTATION=-